MSLEDFKAKHKISPTFNGLSVLDLKERKDLKHDIRTARMYSKIYTYLAYQENKARNELLIASRNRRKASKAVSDRYFRARTESGMRDTHGQDAPETVGTVTMIDPPSIKVDGGDIPTTVIDSAKIDSIKQFLSNPRNIYNISLLSDATTNYDLILNAWNEWINDSFVRAKISNYAYFTGKLRIKFSVSASKYQFGRLLISYQPFAADNDVLKSYTDLFGKTVPVEANLRQCYLSYLSQSMIQKELNIADREAVEFDIPLFLPKEKARLFNPTATVITNSTELNDFLYSGEFRISTFDPIKSTQGTTAAINLRVEASILDMELSTRTATNIDVTAEARRRRKPATAELEAATDLIENAEEQIEQGGGEPDDGYNYEQSVSSRPIYDSSQSWQQRIGNTISKAGSYAHDDQGPLEYGLSAFSNLAGKAKKYPVIGAFASGAETVTKMGSKVAHWFGFSKPLILDKPIYNKPTIYGNMAAYEGHSSYKRLATDPKGEVAMNTSLLETTEEDPLSFGFICKRPAYIASFNWDDNDTPLDTVLWKAALNPEYRMSVAMPSGTFLHQPSGLDFCAKVHAYWRGDITFKFKVVASTFHTGSLVITIEPNMHQSALILADDLTLNQNNNIILDIQSETEVTVTAKFDAPNNYLACPHTQNGDSETPAAADNNGTSCTLTDFSLYDSFGTISVRPYSILTQPDVTADVKVYVYAWSDNMEFQVPYANTEQQYNYAVTEASVIDPGDSVSSKIAAQNFGEVLTSFRAELKRPQLNFSRLTSISSTNDARYQYIDINPEGVLHDYPRNAATASPYISANSYGDLYSYLKFAYIARRGSIRWDLTVTGDVQVEAPHKITCTYDPSSDYLIYDPAQNTGRFNSLADYIDVHGCDNAGTIMNGHYHEGNLQVELPNYTNDNYDISFAALVGEIVFSVYLNTRHTYRFGFTNRTRGVTGGDKTILAFKRSAGEDFSFLGYMGPPFNINGSN